MCSSKSAVSAWRWAVSSCAQRTRPHASRGEAGNDFVEEEASVTEGEDADRSPMRASWSMVVSPSVERVAPSPAASWRRRPATRTW